MKEPLTAKQAKAIDGCLAHWVRRVHYPEGANDEGPFFVNEGSFDCGLIVILAWPRAQCVSMMAYRGELTRAMLSHHHDVVIEALLCDLSVDHIYAVTEGGAWEEPFAAMLPKKDFKDALAAEIAKGEARETRH